MPLAASRLEVLQVRKLIQCVRQQDLPQITKMIELGVSDLLNYQGSYRIAGNFRGYKLTFRNVFAE